MALIRDVTIGVRGANNKLEKHHTHIPADWVTGDRDALKEIYENAKLRTKISVAPNAAVFAEISEPYDPVGAGVTVLERQ